MCRIFMIAFILIPFIGKAQLANEVVWSPFMETVGYYEMIGEKDGNVYLSRAYSSYFGYHNLGTEVFKVDPTLEVVAYNTEDLRTNKKAFELKNVLTGKGIAKVFLTTDTKGMNFLVKAQLLSYEDTRSLEVIELQSTRPSGRYSADLDILKDDIFHAPEFDVILSEDKTKMVVMYSEERVGKKKETLVEYSVFDLYDNFNLLHKSGFYLEHKSTKIRLNDVQLSNSGALGMLLKVYEDDRGKETNFQKQPAYNYEYHFLTGDEREYIYDFKVVGDFKDDMIFSIDGQNNSYFVNSVSKKPGGDKSAYHIYKLDEGGNLLWKNERKLSKNEIIEITGDDKKDIPDDYILEDILVADDMVYLVTQIENLSYRDDWNPNFNNGFWGSPLGMRGGAVRRQTYPVWNLDNIVIQGYDNRTGDRLWTSSIERRSQDLNELDRYFSKPAILLQEGGIVAIYNDRIENISPGRKDKKPKRIELPRDESSTIVVTISKMGEQRVDFLEGMNEAHVPYRGVVNNGNTIYLIEQQDNLRDIRIGRFEVIK